MWLNVPSQRACVVESECVQGQVLYMPGCRTLCFYVCRLPKSSWLEAVTEAVLFTRICTLHNSVAKAGFRQMDVDSRTAAHNTQVQHFRTKLLKMQLLGEPPKRFPVDYCTFAVLGQLVVEIKSMDFFSLPCSLGLSKCTLQFVNNQKLKQILDHLSRT